MFPPGASLPLVQTPHNYGAPHLPKMLSTLAASVALLALSAPPAAATNNWTPWTDTCDVLQEKATNDPGTSRGPYVLLTRDTDSNLEGKGCDCVGDAAYFDDNFDSFSKMTYKYEMFIGGHQAGSADGMSLSFVDTCGTINHVAEEGSGVAFSVFFDTYRNGHEPYNEYGLFVGTHKVLGRTTKCFRQTDWVTVEVTVESVEKKPLSMHANKRIGLRVSSCYHNAEKVAHGVFKLSGYDQHAARVGSQADWHAVKNMRVKFEHPCDLCVDGVLNRDGTACCDGQCEGCGGCDCGSFTGGADACCPGTFAADNTICVMPEDTRCILPGFTLPPPSPGSCA